MYFLRVVDFVPEVPVNSQSVNCYGKNGKQLLQKICLCFPSDATVSIEI